MAGLDAAGSATSMPLTVQSLFGLVEVFADAGIELQFRHNTYVSERMMLLSFTSAAFVGTLMLNFFLGDAGALFRALLAITSLCCLYCAVLCYVLPRLPIAPARLVAVYEVTVALLCCVCGSFAFVNLDTGNRCLFAKRDDDDPPIGLGTLLDCCFETYSLHLFMIIASMVLWITISALIRVAISVIIFLEIAVAYLFFRQETEIQQPTPMFFTLWWTLAAMLLGIFREKALRDGFVWRLEALQCNIKRVEMQRSVDLLVSSFACARTLAGLCHEGKYVVSWVHGGCLWAQLDGGGDCRADADVMQIQRLFVAFDVLSRRLGVDKVKTVGDAYWAVAGGEKCGQTPCERVVRLGCALQQYMLLSEAMKIKLFNMAGVAEVIHVPETSPKRGDEPKGCSQLHLRVGVHCGVLAFGVPVPRRLRVDAIGPSVTQFAFHLATHECPNGQVAVSSEVADACSDCGEFEFTPSSSVSPSTSWAPSVFMAHFGELELHSFDLKDLFVDANLAAVDPPTKQNLREYRHWWHTCYNRMSDYETQLVCLCDTLQLRRMEAVCSLPDADTTASQSPSASPSAACMVESVTLGSAQFGLSIRSERSVLFRSKHWWVPLLTFSDPKLEDEYAAFLSYRESRTDFPARIIVVLTSTISLYPTTLAEVIHCAYSTYPALFAMVVIFTIFGVMLDPRESGLASANKSGFLLSCFGFASLIVFIVLVVRESLLYNGMWYMHVVAGTFLVYFRSSRPYVTVCLMDFVFVFLPVLLSELWREVIRRDARCGMLGLSPVGELLLNGFMTLALVFFCAQQTERQARDEFLDRKSVRSEHSVMMSERLLMHELLLAGNLPPCESTPFEEVPRSGLPVCLHHFPNVVLIAWEHTLAEGGPAASSQLPIETFIAGTHLSLIRSLGDTCLIGGPLEPNAATDTKSRALCQCVTVLCRLVLESSKKGLSYRCGVHVGECLGATMGYWRWTFDVFGAAVHHVFCLQQVAHRGEICCSTASTDLICRFALQPRDTRVHANQRIRQYNVVACDCSDAPQPTSAVDHIELWPPETRNAAPEDGVSGEAAVTFECMGIIHS